MKRLFVRKNKNLNKLSAITSYIKENYTGDLTLEEVARIFDYSPNYLSRMFRKYAGITFKSYVQSIRLDYALKDLDGGRYSITEVALRNGFFREQGACQGISEEVWDAAE